MELHLVDGTYELFRAYYGAPKRAGPGGREVGATRAFARSMLSLLGREGATHVAVAFDQVIESFRNEMFAGYKTGEGIEPDLLAQFELVEQAAAALGLVVWPMVEFEADDALASAAHRFARARSVGRICLCSPDKDLAQLVCDPKVRMRDRMRDITLDEAGVREKFGVAPASIPDYLALVGDSADGIPGIPRWGKKSSATVLSVYERLDAIPDDPEAWTVKVRGAKSLAANLAGAREEATLYRELATLRRDVPITQTPSDLRWRGADREALGLVCEALGDTRLMDAVPRWR